MCWSAQVSLNTFIFATFAAVIGVINNYNWRILLFVYVYSFMQFIEYMLWGTIDRNTNKIIDKKTNMIWSIIGFGLILAEPYFAINIIKNLRFKYALNILYTVVAIYLINISSKDFRTTVGKNGHLYWNWDRYSIDKIEGYPRINDMMFIIPKKYYRLIEDNEIDYVHEACFNIKGKSYEDEKG
jgi:hypothetical protein